MATESVLNKGPLGGKKTPFYKKSKFKTNMFVLSLVIIPLLNFLVFWVYVSFDTIALTFQRYSNRQGEYLWIGLDRYVEVIRQYVLGLDGHPENFATFWNSFHAVAINLIILPLAFLAAYAFYKKIPCEKYFRICFYLPSIISVSVLALCYRYMFHADFGPLKQLFAHFGYEPLWLGPESKQMWTLIYIFAIWAGLSVNVIMMNSAMLRIPSDISEYSKLEGVGFWREAVQIVLPLVLPTVGIYIIAVFTSVFGFVLHPMLIAAQPGIGNKFYTAGWQIFDSVRYGHQDDMALASTLGIVLTLMVTPVVVLIRFLVNKFTPEVDF